ncbi:uncharacterized protein CELE_Y43F8B.29 [Caenorhabditis elegans]|uniref:Uncharacterized protein n=1 Tax=Caenorhabditis elegans TaxID=6239 RepID=I2HAI3_CAEEL|nr:Uncharacterized protein CELE_Y43F8B.29 [Caenorhabditis elegans]CCH63911.1 Uncharacterized protein CELE_Y43F8B.29 [Caenorhabditis elegans]|eukprot:NP_001263940.1 Uncharacterized protein CELE_Y43F8B.29 [Caenorhabditis elegans]
MCVCSHQPVLHLQGQLQSPTGIALLPARRASRKEKTASQPGHPKFGGLIFFCFYQLSNIICFKHEKLCCCWL